MPQLMTAPKTQDTFTVNVEGGVVTTNPVGRPTAYDPSYCLKAIELGTKGKSLEQISGALGITYRTLCRWRDEHEDFCHALEEAKVREMIWWEDHAQSYLVEHKDGEKLNVGLWSRSMAARFPKKYSERIRQELTGAEGAPLLKSVEIMFIDAEPTNSLEFDGNKSKD
jgi:hypothetical protein